jgi:hypothetical protein
MKQKESKKYWIHSMCVQACHQSMKSMIWAVVPDILYSDVLAKLVCADLKECMLYRCKSCSDSGIPQYFYNPQRTFRRTWCFLCTVDSSWSFFSVNCNTVPWLIHWNSDQETQELNKKRKLFNWSCEKKQLVLQLQTEKCACFGQAEGCYRHNSQITSHIFVLYFMLGRW